MPPIPPFPCLKQICRKKLALLHLAGILTHNTRAVPLVRQENAHQGRVFFLLNLTSAKLNEILTKTQICVESLFINTSHTS